MNEEVDIRPSLGQILNGYERQNYKPETAIAEFVDNSTASFFQNKPLLKAYHKNDYKLKIEIFYNSGTKTLTIKDNAFGMDLETFKDALTIAKPPKIKGRNEYGMGLKTAASWFGKRWTVETSTYGCNRKYFAEIDIKSLMKTKANTIEITSSDEDIDKHGTIITIMELSRRITPSNIEKLSKDLESIYRRDLSNDDISIFVDGSELSYHQPEILEEIVDGKKIVWKQDFNSTLNFEGKDYKIKGFCALRQEGSYNETGFTLFRKNRVIVGGMNKGFKPEKIFKASNSFMSLRLFGEVDLDDWPVTQSKDDFDWELNGLKDQFVDELYILCKDYIKKAKEYRSQKDKKDAQINSLETKVFADSTIKDINCINPEKIKIDDSKPIIETETISKNEEHSSYTVSIDVLGFKYKVKVKFISEPKEELIKVKDNDENIEIIINSAFPLFAEMEYDRKFLNLLQKYLVISVIAEKYAYQTSQNDGLIKPYVIRESINQILCEISENRGDYHEEYDN